MLQLITVDISRFIQDPHEYKCQSEINADVYTRSCSRICY